MPRWELKVYEKDRLENGGYGKPVKTFEGGEDVTRIKHLLKILLMTLNINWVEEYFTYKKIYPFEMPNSLSFDKYVFIKTQWKKYIYIF